MNTNWKSRKLGLKKVAILRKVIKAFEVTRTFASRRTK